MPARLDLDARLPATWLVVVANLAAHVGTAVVRVAGNGRGGWLGALWFVRPLRFRVAWGGQLGTLVADGQVWRLFTSPFLHHGAVHLLLNVVGIWSVGRILEPWVGPTRLLGWGLAAAFAGAVASHVVGVTYTDGSSGLAFGLLGAAAAIAWRARGDDPPARFDERWWLERGLGILLAASLALTVVLPFLNLAAHVGGAVVGLALGATWRGPTRVGTAAWAAWDVAYAAVLAWAFFGR